MVPAHHFRYALPGELDGGDNLVSNHGVVAHLPKFSWLQSAGLAEDMFVYAYLSNVVQIAGGANLIDLMSVHAQGFRHPRGVTPHPQRVSVLVNVLHINR